MTDRVGSPPAPCRAVDYKGTRVGRLGERGRVQRPGPIRNSRLMTPPYAVGTPRTPKRLRLKALIRCRAHALVCARVGRPVLVAVAAARRRRGALPGVERSAVRLPRRHRLSVSLACSGVPARMSCAAARSLGTRRPPARVGARQRDIRNGNDLVGGGADDRLRRAARQLHADRTTAEALAVRRGVPRRRARDAAVRAPAGRSQPRARHADARDRRRRSRRAPGQAPVVGSALRPATGRIPGLRPAAIL